jgi:hypothetical protein
MTLPPLLETTMPLAPNRLITRFRSVLPPAVMLRPFAPAALLPDNSTIGAPPTKPGCVAPSMTTGTVIVGNADVGAIVTGPEPTAKLTVLVTLKTSQRNCTVKCSPILVSLIMVASHWLKPGPRSMPRRELPMVPSQGM